MNGASEEKIDAALIAQGIRGDEDALERLYRRHAGPIYRHLCVLLGRPTDAEDALQQTFLAALRNLHRFAGSSRFSTWLHGIGVGVALNIRRSRRRRDAAMRRFQETGNTRADLSGPEARTQAQEDIASLERHLGKLPADRQMLFLLYYVEQLELHEVAQRMGMNEAKAWARIKRARNALLRSITREARSLARRDGRKP